MTHVSIDPPPIWHTLTAEIALERLDVSTDGLTTNAADRRRELWGPNELKAVKGVSIWSILFDQFKNALILILMVGAGLSVYLGHDIEAIAIAAIVLFAVGLGFFQEFRAERAIDALRRMAAPIATVLRNGEEFETPSRELVPGDIVLLAAGDRVPADLRLIEAINLQVEEASLTGESVPVAKRSPALPNPSLTLGDRRNMAYAGTLVAYGRGRAVVVAIGMGTEFGKIAQMLQSVETGRTPLQENLDKVGHVLAIVALVLVGFVVTLGLMRGSPLIEMLIFGIALAVAVVPEALPAVVTISLAIGVQRMVKRHALMRRLPAVETLGSTTVICSDKTGTLTKDEMTAIRLYVAVHTICVSGAGYEPHGEFSSDGKPVQPDGALALLLRSVVLASDAHMARDDEAGRWRIQGDPTEGALIVAAAKTGLHKPDLENRFPRIGEIPFTSETKRMTTLNRDGERLVAHSKGAPEVILASCTQQLTDDGPRELDASSREAILSAAQAMSSEALRVLAVANKQEATLETAEHDLLFLGLVGMIDPPRPEARDAIQTCERAGIKTVMITVDHPLTAQAVARELGLIKNGRIVTGPELEAMTDTQLEAQVEAIVVYARVSPAHKLRVVMALQKNGHIVAMTGDGVNDAPALKKADIGIAMGVTGTDVSKEAAAMTLTDDNFASIVAAIEEGRSIFGNVKKYLMYLLSSNIGEIVVMAGAVVIGLPLPLNAVQLLYVNLATDGLPALALAVDPPESDLMARKPRNSRVGIFTRPVVILMLTGGLWSGAVNIGLFAWALESGRSLEEAMTMTFVSLVLIQFFKAYNFRSDRHSVLDRPFANKWLNLAILSQLLMLAVVVYLPVLNEPFGTYSLSLADWLVVVSLAFTVSPVLEVVKWMERRGWLGNIS